MTWRGTPKMPVVGFELVRLERGDTLAALEEDSGVTAMKIAAANGVDRDARGKTCDWGRAVDAWVIGTGGRRLLRSRARPNPCDPTKGFAAFVDGQQIYAPIGSRAPAADTAPRAAGLGIGTLVLFVVGGALLLKGLSDG